MLSSIIGTYKSGGFTCCEKRGSTRIGAVYSQKVKVGSRLTKLVQNLSKVNGIDKIVRE